jgi:hypothetical protein
MLRPTHRPERSAGREGALLLLMKPAVATPPTRQRNSAIASVLFFSMMFSSVV